MVACEPGPGTRAFCTKEEEDRTPLVRWGDRGLKRELMEIAGREDDECSMMKKICVSMVGMIARIMLSFST